MKKLIFDFDGVLVDSMPYYTRAIVGILETRGIPYDRREVVQDVTTLSRAEIAGYLIDRLGVSATEEDIVAEIDGQSAKAYREAIPAKEGVPQTLRELRREGYSLSVLTATPHPLVDDCLCRLGLYDLFDRVWSCDDFGMSKNTPDIFRAAAERLESTPDGCIMLDDNITALTNAKAAGMGTIGVYDPTSSRLNGQIKAICDDYVYQLRDLLPIIGNRRFPSVDAYISFHWDGVIRVCREDRDQRVGLPYPFTVPAVGYFETLYYWDTYFTNVGLLLDGRAMLAKNNTDNMLYLVEKYGFMPNSNGTYHLDHSQPPFLSLMVKELYDCYGDRVWLSGAYAMLCREYTYWMTERSTPIGLNRYDTSITDRAYLATRAADYEMRIHQSLHGDRADIGRHYLATCESGYDCNSRFGTDIFRYAPVCLNSLLYRMEINMADFARILGKPEDESALWLRRAEERAERMRQYLRDADGCFRDYNFVTGKLSPDFSCASAFPLYAGLATEREAADFYSGFIAKLEAEYGVLANAKNDIPGSYQWGYPNGWAPHQMIVIQALDRYGYRKDAARIAEKYVTLIDRVFAATGKLWEKYNVVNGSNEVEDEDHGGMPPMMGWTAGVYRFAQSYRKEKQPK